MTPIGIHAETKYSFDAAITETTRVLQENGFGILTRIDFDQKIKEKLGHTLPKTAILGACNPAFAYEAYLKNPEMLLLIPCNAVVSEILEGTRISFIRPSAMIAPLGSSELDALSKNVDGLFLDLARKLEAESGKES